MILLPGHSLPATLSFGPAVQNMCFILNGFIISNVIDGDTIDAAESTRWPLSRIWRFT